MKTKDALKVIGLGIVTAAITSCSDGKEKQQQDDKQKAKTEQVSNAQKTIQDLNSHGIPVLKAGEKGKPDSLLSSVEQEGNVYSNWKYMATDDVSKALGIEVDSYEITEIKINRKEANREFGERFGELKTGDVLKLDGGYKLRVLDDNAENSLKMKIRYKYKDSEDALNFSSEKERTVGEFGKRSDKGEKLSKDWEWKIDHKSDTKYKSTNEKALYKDEAVEIPLGSAGDFRIEAKKAVFIFDFGDLSKANIVRDANLPEKPKAPKRKIGDAMMQMRTLAEVKKYKR